MPARNPVNLLTRLTEQRQAHSQAVARQARVAAQVHHPELADDAELAGLLHDIGYAQPGVPPFHPLDGAGILQAADANPLICSVAAFHTAALVEAGVRGIPRSRFDPHRCDDPTAAILLSIVTWADLNTGPGGAVVDPAGRVGEILSRYPAGHPVHTAIGANRCWLLHAGSHPLATVEDDLDALADAVLATAGRCVDRVS